MIVLDYMKCTSSELYLVSYLLQLPGVEFDLFGRGLGFRVHQRQNSLCTLLLLITDVCGEQQLPGHRDPRPEVPGDG